MKGIRRHGNGFEAYVRINGQLHTQHFDRATPFRDMRDWRDATRLKFQRQRAKTGTFAADVNRYLAAVRSMITYADREREIRAWIPRFGSRRRQTIEAVEIRAQIEAWMTPPDRCLECGGKVDTLPADGALDAPAPRCGRCGGVGGPGYAAQTVRNRRTALMHLWHVLDGKAERNPVRDAPAPRPTPAAPRGLPYDVIAGILDAMPDQGRGDRHETRPTVSKTKIRCRVMAWTGIPPAQIRRLDPARDFHLSVVPPYITVQQRMKGGGTRPRRAELAPEAVAALQDFIAHDCAGPFSTSSVWKSFTRAAAAVGFVGVRPYDLRHSFLTGIYAATGDINVTAKAGDHSDVKLTQRYTLAVHDDRLVAAIAAFRARANGQQSTNAAMQPEAVAARLRLVRGNVGG